MRSGAVRFAMARNRDEHPLEHELNAERAAALGRAGKRLETALAALATSDRDLDLIDEAATAAWYYMITRESMRMYDHKIALAIYGVPDYVLARVGVIRR
jgi:Family of unknown function (DUF6665)